MDPITLSLIAGTVQGIGSSISGRRAEKRTQKAQEIQNEKDRAFTRAMYDKQRQDNISDWNAMNKYNSPEQQMQRLREAGLNPNLVYGKGADNTAVMIKGSNPTTNNQPVVGYKDHLTPAMQAGMNTITQYQNYKMQQQQTDNLQKQAALMQQEAELKQAQTETERSRKAGQDIQNIKSGTERNILDWDYNQKLKLGDINIRSAELDRDLKEQALALNLDKYELQRLESAQNRRLVYQQMLKTKEERLAQEIQNDIARNTKEEVIRYKKLELDVLRQNLRNLEKTGRLLDNQDIDFAIDHEIKQNKAAQIKAETENTNLKNETHYLEIGLGAVRGMPKKGTTVNKTYNIKK